MFSRLLVVHGGHWTEDLWDLLPPPFPVSMWCCKCFWRNVDFCWEKIISPEVKMWEFLLFKAGVPILKNLGSGSKAMFISLWLDYWSNLVNIATIRIRKISRRPPRGSWVASWRLAAPACSLAPCLCPPQTGKLKIVIGIALVAISGSSDNIHLGTISSVHFKLLQQKLSGKV